MTFKITFGPHKPTPGVERRTITKSTAVSALFLVEQLEISDVKTEIEHPVSHRISHEELRRLAEKEELEALNKRRK